MILRAQPFGGPAQYSALALGATAVGIVALVPHLPAALSALLLSIFIGVGPGCATLAWTGAPGISRLLLIPSLGLGYLIVVCGTAATVGWWAPKGVFVIVALTTAWSILPNLPAVLRDITS